MEHEPIVRIHTQTNLVVVQLPERRKPGVVVQVDSLRNLARIVDEAKKSLSNGELEEGGALVDEAASLLRLYVDSLDAVT